MIQFVLISIQTLAEWLMRSAWARDSSELVERSQLLTPDVFSSLLYAPPPRTTEQESQRGSSSGLNGSGWCNQERALSERSPHTHSHVFSQLHTLFRANILSGSSRAVPKLMTRGSFTLGLRRSDWTLASNNQKIFFFLLFCQTRTQNSPAYPSVHPRKSNRLDVY